MVSDVLTCDKSSGSLVSVAVLFFHMDDWKKKIFAKTPTNHLILSRSLNGGDHGAA